MQVKVISDTIQEFNGIRYYLCDKYFQKNGRRLHVEVWESVNGLTPKGWHVHHKDENRSNNQLSNLEALPGGEHLSLHMTQPDRVQKSKVSIQKARIAASEWHGSEAGRAWHSKNYHENVAHLRDEMVDLVCSYCQKPYQMSKLWAKNSQFCSANCKSIARRKSGVDDEQRQCQACGAEFTVNKYARKITCSKKCASKLCWDKRLS